MQADIIQDMPTYLWNSFQVSPFSEKFKYNSYPSHTTLSFCDVMSCTTDKNALASHIHIQCIDEIITFSNMLEVSISLPSVVLHCVMNRWSMSCLFACYRAQQCPLCGCPQITFVVFGVRNWCLWLSEHCLILWTSPLNRCPKMYRSAGPSSITIWFRYSIPLHEHFRVLPLQKKKL